MRLWLWAFWMNDGSANSWPVKTFKRWMRWMRWNIIKSDELKKRSWIRKRINNSNSRQKGSQKANSDDEADRPRCLFKHSRDGLFFWHQMSCRVFAFMYEKCGALASLRVWIKVIRIRVINIIIHNADSHWDKYFYKHALQGVSVATVEKLDFCCCFSVHSFPNRTPTIESEKRPTSVIS